jgi:hypothetical protein
MDLLGTIDNREHSLDLGAIGLPRFDLDLGEIFSEAEVWETIKAMPSDRAPGPNGFIGAFYKRAWPIIKRDVMAALLKLFMGDGRTIGRLNRALISLILKKQEAEKVGDFRPNNLIHSLVKIFSKLLANRLLPKMAELEHEPVTVHCQMQPAQ